MSLPFRIGDVVEVDAEKILTAPELRDFVGRPGVVKTMGLEWVKITFEGVACPRIVSNDKLKRVVDKVFSNESV